jgi:two-component system response regulator NreC
MINIALIEDHSVVRQGIRVLLEAEEGFSVVGEAADGLQVVPLVDQLRPDVLVLDLILPGLNGFEVIRRVLERFPSTRIVILSMQDDNAHVWQALTNGAIGYVLKGCDISALVTAIREAIAGRRYLSPPLSEDALANYEKQIRDVPEDAYDTLTAREVEVLHLAAEGLSNAEIGVRLEISQRTAETHRANMTRKLGLHNQIELVRYAMQRGIIRLN